jgi:hypothetical protein
MFLQKEQYVLIFPLLLLGILIFILNIPQILQIEVPGLSNLSFAEKTNLILTVAIAFFAAIEGHSTFRRASMESKRHAIEDARNELEKAYGPLYTLLNNRSNLSNDDRLFWLEFEDRKKLDDIMATYPFMFPSRINELWQKKIRNVGSLIEASDFNSKSHQVTLGVYLELRSLINEEYERKVKQYHHLLEK